MCEHCHEEEYNAVILNLEDQDLECGVITIFEMDGQDYIVLNSVSNVNKALYPLGNYERIHCFFDNDHAGMEALRQIREEYGRDRYIRDASQTYSGCKDLNEYLQEQAERKRQVQSAKGVRSQSPEKKNGFRL